MIMLDNSIPCGTGGCVCIKNIPIIHSFILFKNKSMADPK